MRVLLEYYNHLSVHFEKHDRSVSRSRQGSFGLHPVPAEKLGHSRRTRVHRSAESDLCLLGSMEKLTCGEHFPGRKTFCCCSSQIIKINLVHYIQ